MSAQAVLTALAAILPPGTKVAQTVIQKGISTIVTAGSPGFPALILNAPDSHRERVGIGTAGPWQWTHRIHAIYVNQWQAAGSARTFEQLLTAAGADLDIMIDNLDANIALVQGGIDYASEAGMRIDRHLDAVPTDVGLGFPVVSGYLIIEVLDLWERAT